MVRWMTVAVLGMLAAACDEGPCEQDVTSCDGDFLLVCDNGAFVEEADCTEEGGSCEPEPAAHCHTEGMKM